MWAYSVWFGSAEKKVQQENFLIEPVCRKYKLTRVNARPESSLDQESIRVHPL